MSIPGLHRCLPPGTDCRLAQNKAGSLHKQGRSCTTLSRAARTGSSHSGQCVSTLRHSFVNSSNCSRTASRRNTWRNLADSLRMWQCCYRGLLDKGRAQLLGRSKIQSSSHTAPAGTAMLEQPSAQRLTGGTAAFASPTNAPAPTKSAYQPHIRVLPVDRFSLQHKHRLYILNLKYFEWN